MPSPLPLPFHVPLRRIASRGPGLNGWLDKLRWRTIDWLRTHGEPWSGGTETGLGERVPLAYSPPPYMSTTPDILVLFDIDGTLLDTHGAGRAAFCRGLQRVTGVEDALPYVSFAGNTDRRVLDEVAAHRGIDFTKAQRKAVFDAVAEELAAALKEAPGAAVPGAAELLAELSRRGARLGLVTGNIERGAHLKLASAGLDGFFSFGGYGDDEADRSLILRTALAAAGSAPARAVLVGDTPLDIEAGLAVGIPVLGVAAGRWDVSDLLVAGATHAAADYLDLPRWIEWIYKPT